VVFGEHMQAKKNSASLKALVVVAAVSLLSFFPKNTWANQMPKFEPALKSPNAIAQTVPKSSAFGKKAIFRNSPINQQSDTANLQWRPLRGYVYLSKIIGQVNGNDTTFSCPAPDTILAFSNAQQVFRYTADSVMVNLPQYPNVKMVKTITCLWMRYAIPSYYIPVSSVRDTASALTGDSHWQDTSRNKVAIDSNYYSGATAQVGCMAMFSWDVGANGEVVKERGPSHITWIRFTQSDIVFISDRYATTGLYFTNVSDSSLFGWSVGGYNSLREPIQGGLLVDMITGGINAPTVVPRTFSLSQNYPNPFNPKTTFTYALTKNELVLLELFNVAGQKVGTLVNELQRPGTYKIEFDASDLAAGAYFYRMTAGKSTETKKMLLVK
jgi:hypothetical protein